MRAATLGFSRGSQSEGLVLHGLIHGGIVQLGGAASESRKCWLGRRLVQDDAVRGRARSERNRLWLQPLTWEFVHQGTTQKPNRAELKAYHPVPVREPRTNCVQVIETRVCDQGPGGAGYLLENGKKVWRCLRCAHDHRSPVPGHEEGLRRVLGKAARTIKVDQVQRGLIREPQEVDVVTDLAQNDRRAYPPTDPNRLEGLAKPANPPAMLANDREASPTGMRRSDGSAGRPDREQLRVQFAHVPMRDIQV